MDEATMTLTFKQATDAFDKMHDAHSKLENAKLAVREASDAVDDFRRALKALPFTEDKSQVMAYATCTSLDLRQVATKLAQVEVIK